MKQEKQGRRAPRKEEVLEWVKKDLESCHYLLGVVLKLYPEVVARMADDVFETIMEKEKGAAVDHVTADSNGR